MLTFQRGREARGGKQDATMRERDDGMTTGLNLFLCRNFSAGSLEIPFYTSQIFFFLSLITIFAAVKIGALDRRICHSQKTA